MINTHDLWAMEHKALSSLLASMSVMQPDPEAGRRDGLMEPGEYTVSNGVAVIPIRGVLSVNPSYYGKLFGYATAFADIRTMAAEAAQDPAVEAIILNIDSPGGTVAGTQETAAALRAAGKQKPLYAWTSGNMTSAAYWLASAAQRIGSVETAQIGSIGVIATMMEMTKMAKKAGVKFNIIKTGQWKAAGHPFKAMTSDERDYFQERVDEVLTIFIRDVARYRGVDEEQAAMMSDDARVYLGRLALDVGLIDSVHTNMDDFIIIANKENKAMDIKELKGKHPELYDAVKTKGAEAAIAEVSEKLERAEARVQAAEERVMAIVDQVADEATIEKIRVIMETGLDAEKIERLQAVFGGSSEESAAAGTTQQQILEALQKLTPPAAQDGGDSGETDDDKRRAKAKAIADRANR